MTTALKSSEVRAQLDPAFTRLREITAIETPTTGWIRTIRDALGMTAEQLGHRMGITGASVRSIESKERDLGVRLASLQKAAEAMDCTLVYAFVPNSSLEQTVKTQATHILNQQVATVRQTMALEDQTASLSESDLEKQLERILKSRNLWSVS
jgi:predicted DNA-binding mobile mystery protein A